MLSLSYRRSRRRKELVQHNHTLLFIIICTNFIERILKKDDSLPENKDIRLQFPYTIKNCIRIFTFVNVLAALEDELLLGILAVIK